MGLLYAAGVGGVLANQARAAVYLFFATLGGDLDAHLAMGYVILYTLTQGIHAY